MGSIPAFGSAGRFVFDVKASCAVWPRIETSNILLQRLMATNLVHNAIVHHLPAQDSVWVTTGVHHNSEVLSVENTGEQLTPQLASTLVEPFLRGTNRVHTDHAGVGLGLAIVKNIIKHMTEP